MRTYFEPFVGGGAVFFGVVAQGRQFDRAVLGDANEELVRCYQAIQKNVDAVIRALGRHRYDRELYYKVRERDPGTLSDAGRAARLIYLNRCGYNGLYRVNSSGRFNVPFGRYKTINYRTDFLEFKSVFKNWEFTNTDFDEIPLKAGDFVYADPPYDVEFTTYSKGGFGWSEQERTAKWLAKHDGPVLLSNQATKRIVDLYAGLGYKLQFLDAPRRISCTGDRTPAPEVLASRNL